MRRDEYIKQLLLDRKKETIPKDFINEYNISNGEGLTSPTTPTTTEESRLLKEYIERKNLFHLTSASEERRKTLTLKSFFRMKRNQQVEIFVEKDETHAYVVGKVEAIGRDFVMITNLRDRYWLPYRTIVSANIPFGIPNYANTHQHYLYDNDLRSKLVLNFGETVANREQLLQLFCEDSLKSNLSKWRDTWLSVGVENGGEYVGKLISVLENEIVIKVFKRNHQIPFNQITRIRSVRLLRRVQQWLFVFFRLRRRREDGEQSTTTSRSVRRRSFI